jgi:hypothetical protein
MRLIKAAGNRVVMRFLLRLAFWLGVVLVLLPSGGSQSAPKVEISAGDAFSAARATMADAQKFCERQPDACVFGSQAAIALGHRAQAGAKMVYDFLNQQLGPNESRPASTSSTTTPAAAVPLPVARPSQHTLTPDDLAPAWRGPQPLDSMSSGRSA